MYVWCILYLCIWHWRTSPGHNTHGRHPIQTHFNRAPAGRLLVKRGEYQYIDRLIICYASDTTEYDRRTSGISNAPPHIKKRHQPIQYRVLAPPDPNPAYDMRTYLPQESPSFVSPWLLTIACSLFITVRTPNSVGTFLFLFLFY